MMEQLLAAAPWWAPWLIAAVSLATALVALCYARIADISATSQLDAAHRTEQRLRRYRSLQILKQAQEVWEQTGDSDLKGEVLDRVGELLQRAQNIDPGNTRVLRAQNRLLLLTDRSDEAAAAYQTPLPLEPEDQTIDPLPPAVTLLTSQGRYEEATDLCLEVLEIDESNAHAHNTLGVIFRKTGRLEAAAVACRRATALEPTYVSAHINLGVALRHLGRLIQSEAAYRRAIELEPRHAAAHSSLGVALKKQGREEEAELCYMKAIEIDPTYTPAWLNLAIALQERGALDEAEAAYRCALELDVSAPLPDLDQNSSVTAA